VSEAWESVERGIGRIWEKVGAMKSTMRDGTANGISLRGDEGREPAERLARIFRGTLSVDDLDDHYRLSPNGRPRLVVDRATFAALSGRDSS
jgi:hypothetical protein